MYLFNGCLTYGLGMLVPSTMSTSSTYFTLEAKELGKGIIDLSRLTPSLLYTFLSTNALSGAVTGNQVSLLERVKYGWKF